MNPHDHTEDAEFEDFLKGEGDLARQLHDLPQPQPPAALSVAILARAAADMRSAGAEPANDALHDAAPAAAPARHYLRRARVPLGLAASAVFALFAVRVLMPQAVAPVAKEPVVVAAAPVAEAPPPAIDIESAPQPPAPKAVQRKRSATRTAPATDIAAAADAERATPPVLAAPSIAPSILAAPQVMAAPLAKRSAVLAAREESKQLVLQPEPGAEGPLLAAPAPFARMQAPMMSASASKPRPMSYFGAAAEDPPAPEWLDRIAEMLKAGQTKEAHAEWLKFRMRYPDAEVPPELQRQLQAIN
ncbi:hypothetical protein GTP81_14965 [Rugamonas sp. FT107W]|uniref:Uncharacterized protein n=1 Tax=Duganella vulcania TaxID=2692166 RepID=A0A845HKQ0_9BURK|nr:hypothetical protein [Duganella vulcania]MYN18059.1 hypothetical protein [Duganella vulcania]